MRFIRGLGCGATRRTFLFLSHYFFKFPIIIFPLCAVWCVIPWGDVTFPKLFNTAEFTTVSHAIRCCFLSCPPSPVVADVTGTCIWHHINDQGIYVSLSMGAAPLHRSTDPTWSTGYWIVILVVTAMEHFNVVTVEELISSRTNDIKHFCWMPSRTDDIIL